MIDDLRQRLGQAGEELACQHLLRLGFEILERNYRTRWGELDVVAFDGTTLVFCEVKTRRDGGGSPALESVHAAKRRQVRKMAGRWLIDRPDHPHADELRFDAIGVVIGPDGRLLSLEHLEGAF